MLSLNNPVPDFSATTSTNKTIHLSDYCGHIIVLYFYAKDNSAGCTQEARDFRDHNYYFTAANTLILGVSRDSVRSHANFKVKQALPFELLADTDETLCQLFGVMALKNMYGKQVRGIERSTFLISAEGILLHEWRKVKVKGHIEHIISRLSML